MVDERCALCGSGDLTPSLSGWRCGNCGALSRDGKQVPEAAPDEREQAREEAENVRENAGRNGDLMADKGFGKHRNEGAL